MDRADLITQLSRMEIAINKLNEYSFEHSTNLQELLTKFCSFKEDYRSYSLPGATDFDQQIYEIEKNISGLTSDNKGRDLEVFKSRIFDKSKKDLIVFIRLYRDHLSSTIKDPV